MTSWLGVALESNPTDVVDVPLEEDKTVLLSSLKSQFIDAQVNITADFRKIIGRPPIF
mgnify:CR=1 FL=1